MFVAIVRGISKYMNMYIFVLSNILLYTIIQRNSIRVPGPYYNR